ncbi:MAG: Putative ATP /GTP binding protein [uncultured Sulfurovum sp.]|uniref:ATP /GTP binding protein n=1 Tax=uncultured Sulfurovum sp. TaxID=269237 RepID=A0A6S6SHF6_9BACT|nr:MAG: Putative ATP /GTP binding protein [uncultured Sulfurovum sp.]
MKVLEKFVNEFKQNQKEEQHFELGFLGDVKRVANALLDEKFLPSQELRTALNKQIRRVEYPIEIAIVGQFSSGKSTFLNALLSKDILPTGITPVTSKVTYINFGERYEMKVTYVSGKSVFLPITEMESYLDQRKSTIKDIKYLTLYAPLDLLRSISLVDTPGLNSQSQSDTETTNRVLQHVGGIIWLSLIDNAGKHSEAITLEEYMKSFKEKTICLLNQKDKYSPEQIAQTKAYVEEKFSHYFTQVTPISAKLALEGRAHRKEKLLEKEKQNFLELLEQFIRRNGENKDNYLNLFNEHQKNIVEVNSKDYSLEDEKLKASNINEVLKFIKEDILPSAKEKKKLAIIYTLQNMIAALIEQYESIIEVYNQLLLILENTEEASHTAFKDLVDTSTSDLSNIEEDYNEIIEDLSYLLYGHIQKKEQALYVEKEGFMHKGLYEKKSYSHPTIDKEKLDKELLAKESPLNHRLLVHVDNMKLIESQIESGNKQLFKKLYSSVKKWQMSYMLIKKKRDIASGMEFSHLRLFAAQIDENIMKQYKEELYKTRNSISLQFEKHNSKFKYELIVAFRTSLNTLENKIENSVLLHQKEPTKFPIYFPKKDEISMLVKEVFDANHDASLKHDIQIKLHHLKDTNRRIYKDNMDYIGKRQNVIRDKISALTAIAKIT